jgi:hypothetical protein
VNDDYLWDGTGEKDPEIEPIEQLVGRFRDAGHEPDWSRIATPRRWSGGGLFVLGSAATILVALAAAGVWRAAGLAPDSASRSLEVTRVSGRPTIGTYAVDDRRALEVGRWLSTDSVSRASVDVASIGRVDVDENSEVGLISTTPGDYRLQLSKGTLHALIWAPPGQFAVVTPSATAVDYGCSYTLSVGGDGVGVVEVTTGWVGFQWRGQESFVPAGASCVTRPGLGPGTPRFGDTSDAFRAAIDTLDLNRGPAEVRKAALDTILREATLRDDVTLWHLLTRVHGDEKGRVFDALAHLVPAPPGVTRLGIEAADRKMLDAWWDAFGLGTASWWRTWKQTWMEGSKVR